ncbi:NADH-quinone oxidoreductase subunit C/D [uncultured Salinisphaera sp.]|uniref:NADH-quinone oxidoreductase subunit C/D n=1 Tax=uncultured Salinisphaera sp. TaxID=359372 RepID=UPI0032B1E836|tara:strand:+ start:4338 stop:6086 length:1749 start_codon:yes stop_codon:yes gene_type:complete
MLDTTHIQEQLFERFGADRFTVQITADGTPTLWVGRDQIVEVLGYLKTEATPAYRMLYDLTAIDERARQHRPGQPDSDFTVVYHLLSLKPVAEVRLKVALAESDLHAPTATTVWPNANWYEREVWDMFGITFDGHPNLRRLIMPPTWQGHPLRKDHAARATEFEPLHLDPKRQDIEEDALQFKPEDWGMERASEDNEFMFLNMGPNHPSVHGVFRIVLQLDGEEIVGAVPDIGYHHRGAEKMAERQSWHTYIPYTDRVDYLGGVMNELPYVMNIENVMGIQVPERAKCVRVMLSEFFRITSHLMFFGTYVQDIGAMSPIFWMFSDRQKAYDVIEAITGFRMHPAFFRIGGLAMDLPRGWDRLVREFLDWFPDRLTEYKRAMARNAVLVERSKHIGAYSQDEALDWGITGPGLRATGYDFDLRRDRPYSGYENYDFDVPLGKNGDCQDRLDVRIEEMFQSCRIIRQCLENMPDGNYKSDHHMTTPPVKERTMHDIETLIAHFLTVSWGPVIPAMESCTMVEATKGLNSYYSISDKNTMSYRTRIRTPSFAHLQQIPLISQGGLVADLVAIIGSIDFVMADVDR